MQTDTRTVLILGANGRFGQVAMQAFAHAGWNVIAQTRSPARAPLPAAARSLVCDATDASAVLAGCASRIDVVVNALNPLYTEWETRVAPLADSALRIARETGALLMLPGNVYNFGRNLPPYLKEDTPQRADTSKATIRIALEQRMQEAAAQGVRSVVIRAGDFMGGSGPGTWIDLVIAKSLHKGRLVYPGPLGIEHAWAYLPDLARVFVAVAEKRAQLQPFEALHYGGLSLTGAELHAAFERVTGTPLRIGRFPWWLLRAAAPFVPMMRALVEMHYLWQRAHRLEQRRLEALLGTVPQTGIDEVLREFLAGRPKPAAIRPAHALLS